MSLKNITLIPTRDPGNLITWKLIDNEGEVIKAFDSFSQYLINSGFSDTTRKRYTEAAARFLDYSYELGIFGDAATEADINHAIDFYPVFLRDGINTEALDKTKILQEYAKDIGLHNGLSPKSFAPTLAGVNHLLKISQSLAIEAVLKAKQIDPTINNSDLNLVIRAINGSRTLSSFEKTRLRQNSLLGSVIRQKGTITRPHKLSSPVIRTDQSDLIKLDFPLSEMSNLLKSATSCQDPKL